jgi:ABC-2 type transport system permease protein
MLNALYYQLKTSSAVNLQYRAANLIWLIGAVLEPVIYLVVWDTVAKAQGGSVEGFTTSDFAAYFIALLLVDRLTFTWIMWEYEFMIREGTLARRLMRPLHPFWVDLADNIAYKAFILVVLIPTVILLSLFFHPSFQTTWLDFMAFLPALVLAFVLRFCLEWGLAMSAFWTTRTNAINQVSSCVPAFCPSAGCSPSPSRSSSASTPPRRLSSVTASSSPGPRPSSPPCSSPGAPASSSSRPSAHRGIACFT